MLGLSLGYCKVVCDFCQHAVSHTLLTQADRQVEVLRKHDQQAQMEQDLTSAGVELLKLLATMESSMLSTFDSTEPFNELSPSEGDECSFLPSCHEAAAALNVFLHMASNLKIIDSNSK